VNRRERRIYVELADTIDHQVCSFCHHYRSLVYCDSPCDAGDPNCEHPLGDKLDSGIEPGCDCWGFRPAWNVSLAADIVGICLSKQWEGFTAWEDKRNVWRVAEAR